MRFDNQEVIVPERDNRSHVLYVYAFPIATALIAGALAAVGIYWVWREYTLYALVTVTFALFCGGVLPKRHESIRAVFLGVGAGLLVGSLLALRNA